MALDRCVHDCVCVRQNGRQQCTAGTRKRGLSVHMRSRQERGTFGRGVWGVFVCKGPMKEEPAF